MIIKKRVLGNVIDVVSQIGGLLKIFQTVFHFITLPVSHFLFLWVMIRRMYFARSANGSLFANYISENTYMTKYLNLDKIPAALKDDTEFL